MCHNISSSQGLTLVEYCSFTEIYDAGPPRKSDYFLKKLLCYVSRLKVAQNINLSVRGLGSNAHFSARNGAITRAGVRQRAR